ncbi:hypothetical protein QYM36_014329, partial [Artemia franciscana]
EIRGASLCNPVDLHVYETKKPALKSNEAVIILKTAHETSISRFKLCKNTISSYPAAASKYKRSKGRSKVSNQKVIDLYNDDTEMANMKTVELKNKYRNELAVQIPKYKELLGGYRGSQHGNQRAMDSERRRDYAKGGDSAVPEEL